MEAKSFISEIVCALELAMLVGLFMSASSMESVAKALQSIPKRNLDRVTNTELMQAAEGLSLFVDKLPFIRTINGYTISPKGTGLPANLSIGMYLKYWKFHRDLPASRVFAFGESATSATIPGPTIIAMSGVKTYILWENFLPNEHIFTVDNTLETAKPNAGVPTVVHLHGGVTEPESDGSALAWFTNAFRERGERWRRAVYMYHNAAETGTMWYHDHALGYTRLNLLAGLIGAYKIVNPRIENKFQLPEGEFDQILVVMDRSFTKDGQIYINSTGISPDIHPQWQPEYYGNVIVVNGKAWPYMEVQKRKYRFRIINASNARYFNFSLDDGSGFTQIASDAFYLEAPVYIASVLLSASETMDVIIDFSTTKANSVVLINDAPYPFPDGVRPAGADSKVMKFVIKGGPVADDTNLPTHFRPVQKLQEGEAMGTRSFVMYEYDSSTGLPTHLVLNFANFSDPVSEFPKIGSTELWHIINLTPDNHPFHVHLAAFQVLRQQKLKNLTELSACALQHKGVESCEIKGYYDGDPLAPPVNEAGWKSVFKMQPSYLTSILVRFSMTDSKPFPFDPTGEPGYAYHCHILDHEDNVMIRPYVLIN